MTLGNAQVADVVAAAAVVFGLGATWFGIGRWARRVSAIPYEVGDTLGRSRTIALVLGSALILILGLLPAVLFGWGPAA
jgi:hypothetical protein